MSEQSVGAGDYSDDDDCCGYCPDCLCFHDGCEVLGCWGVNPSREGLTRKKLFAFFLLLLLLGGLGLFDCFEDC